MGAHKRYIQYRKDELYHFNKNHDPKDGKFTSSSGATSSSRSSTTNKGHLSLPPSKPHASQSQPATGGGGGYVGYNEDELQEELVKNVLNKIDLTNYGDAKDEEFIKKAVARLKEIMLSDRRFNTGGSNVKPTPEFVEMIKNNPDKYLRGLH